MPVRRTRTSRLWRRLALAGGLLAGLPGACAATAVAADPTVQNFGGGAVEANSIAADADGNAYVLAAEGAPIGKVTPAGVATRIGFPGDIGPSIRLRGIRFGPDGAL